MRSSEHTLQTLNVLMVNTYQAGGGAGRVGALLSKGLRQGGHAVDSFVAGNEAQDLSCHVVRHWRLASMVRWLTARGLPELGELTSLLWCCHPTFAGSDVVHLHNLHGDYLSIAALPLWGWSKPLVWTLHDCWPLTGNCAAPRDCDRWRRSCGRCPQTGVYPMAAVDRSRFYRRLKPWLIRRAAPRMIVPSQWLAERVRASWLSGLAATGRARRGPLRVIHNPVDCDLFRPQPDRRGLRERFGLAPGVPTVVMVGQNWRDPLKGGEHAVIALRRAVARASRSWDTGKMPVPPGQRSVQPREVQLLVIGAGSDELLAHTGLRGRALGVQRDQSVLADAYACADLCLFPSLAENYPLTPLEALACGTPVVAYDVGGIGEQVRDGVTGILARAGEPDALAAGVAALAMNRSAAGALGAAGRQFVLRTCSLPVVVPQYVEEYTRALRAWRGRHGRGPRCRPGALTVRLGRGLWHGQVGTCSRPPHVPTSPRPHLPLPPSGHGTREALISVITPSWNQGRFISRCIESVLAQEYPRFEHIVYDNCSTDETLNVLRRYPHLVWVSEPDSGQSEALNKAIRGSRGEIIAWINADDFYLPGVFDLAARELASVTGVMAIAGGVQLVDPAGGVRQTFRPRFEGLDYLVDFWSHPYGLCQPGVLFRREVIEEVGLFRTDLHFAMDYDFWLRLAEHFDIKTVDAVLAGYVVHEKSKTARGRATMRFWDEMEQVSRRYWGPWLSARRWRLARQCSRYAADQLAAVFVNSCRRSPVPAWGALWRLLRRRPLRACRRHVLVAVIQRAAGRGWWQEDRRPKSEVAATVGETC